jgi:hypothetical protein
MKSFNQLHKELGKSPKYRKAYRKEVCRLEDKKKVEEALATLKKAIRKKKCRNTFCDCRECFAKEDLGWLSDYFKEVYKVKK